MNSASNKPCPNMAQLSVAISIASNAHCGVFDKGGNPYILHPLAVMEGVREHGPLVMAAAVLHDVIEDTKVTYSAMRDVGIGEEVIEMVRAVTRLPGQTEEEYQEQVMQSLGGMRIKMEDLKHNSKLERIKNREITQKDVDRTIRYHKFYLRLVAAVAEKVAK